jgi:hypothetical protein
LLVGKEDLALALIRHFGSIQALSRASFQQLRQFLPQRKAEAVLAAFSVSVIAESEHARSNVFDNTESASVEEDNAQNFLIEKLHVSTTIALRLSLARCAPDSCLYRLAMIDLAAVLKFSLPPERFECPRFLI